MPLLTEIQMRWYGQMEIKYVDMEEYCYLDLLSDIYNSLVRRQIPRGKDVWFKVKAICSNGVEKEVSTDKELYGLKELFGQNAIRVYVYGVEVQNAVNADQCTINNYPHRIICREEYLSPRPGRREKCPIRRGQGTCTTSTNATTTGTGNATAQATATPNSVDSARSESTSIGLNEAEDRCREACREAYVSGDDWEHSTSTDTDWDKASEEEDSSEESDEQEEEEEDEEAEIPEMARDRESDNIMDGYDSEDVYGTYTRADGYDTSTGTTQLYVGQKFQNVDKFREALRDFVVSEGFEFNYKKNERSRVTAECAADGCTWRIHASTFEDSITYMIKTYEPKHTCDREHSNKHATISWIAKKILHLIKSDHNMKSSAILDYLKSEFHIEVPYQKVYRARRLAQEMNEGSYKESYAKLPAYGELLLRANPRSIFKLEYENRNFNEIMNAFDEDPIFKRVFICFHASVNGFIHGCRPFIGLDGCHLKGRYGGVMLAAISLDGNNGLFPLAFAVVEVECKDSWLFFLKNLREALLPVAGNTSLTFMSDKQKGLADAIGMIFPFSHSRCCSRHLLQNFKKKWSGEAFKQHFWAASAAYTKNQFDSAMNALKVLDDTAYQWLMKEPITMWARHSFHIGSKSDHILNNMSESFNHWISAIRHKPILKFLDALRMKLMDRLYQKQHLSLTMNGKVTTNIEKKLFKIQTESRDCISHNSSADQFEVIDIRGRSFVVNLKNWTCTCREWDCTGLPCKHAASAIAHNRGRIHDYCDPWYSVDKFKDAYKEIIHPLDDLSDLSLEGPHGIVQPPKRRRLPGRPHKNRRRETDEGPPAEFRKRTSTVRCDNCKQIGHNRRTCQGAPVKGKRASSKSSSVGVKRKFEKMSQDASSSQRDAASSSMMTRSQASTTTTLQSSQAKTKAKLAAAAAKRKAERAAAKLRRG